MDPKQGQLELSDESPEQDPEALNPETAALEGEGETPPEEPPPPLEPSRADRLEAQLAEEREARIRLEERLRAQEAQRAPQQPPPKIFTRSELRSAVDNGTISEDQMEEIWAKQQRDEIKREMEQDLEKRDRQRETERFIADETAKYIASYPDLRNTQSDTWRRVKQEYDFLVRTGDPDNKATELKALRAALGNAERIQERTANRRETPTETSGSQAPGSGDRPVDIWNRVPKKYRPWYKQQVAEGRKTLEDVKKDIPYMDTTQ